MTPDAVGDVHERDFDPDGPAGNDTLFGLPYTGTQGELTVLSVPFDATASYRRGTAAAPQAILEASWQVDLFDLETGSIWRRGITQAVRRVCAAAENEQAAEWAEVARAGTGDESRAATADLDELCSQINDRVHAWTADAIDAGNAPAVVGGEHGVAFGAIRAACEAYPKLGVLQFDAHADLRAEYEGFAWSHASLMYNVLTHTSCEALVSVGVRDIGEAEYRLIEASDRVSCWYDYALRNALHGGRSFESIATEIVDSLPEDVWISFDIDVFNPALCPNTGTPVPGGLDWAEAMTILRVLADSGRNIVGFDLCEVGAAEFDAIVGARTLYKLACRCLQSRNRATE